MRRFTLTAKLVNSIILAILIVGALVKSGYFSKETYIKPAELTIYSPNSPAMLREMIPAFEKKYGINVKLVENGTGELVSQIRQGLGKTPDVFFGGIYTQFANNEDLFLPYRSEAVDKLLENYSDSSAIATAYTINGNVLLVNKDLTKDMSIESYQDLLNPELKGKIAYADPRSSSSAFSQLTSMLIAKGGYESDAAWSFVKKLTDNYGGVSPTSSSAVYQSVADGKMAVGLTYEAPSLKLIENETNLSLVYPKEGTVFAPSSMAILKKAEHLENAKLFIDFMVSKEVQDALGKLTTNRPIHKEAQLNPSMKPLEDIKTIKEDYGYVTKHQSQILERYTKLVP
ncbi:extracellular solute-binding protein [Streptococcus acidominimus]|uniref:Extracellular solute-binding protein n=1 Tax=Streptococcus acidominimus TaxID=1326 RepID=A0A239XFW6_STRAI|nr:extracellular solute-binding protein [Streptococcus acidominimus]SNV44904.1 extracellular solute-binding protein [Streptococcus acidominimus]